MKQRIKDLIQPVIEEQGLMLWGIELRPGNNGLLRIYIDHAENGVGIGDCEVVSREVSGLLDVHDFIPYNYTLEVSSPGLDRLLFEPEQYQQFSGEEVRVETIEKVHDRKRFAGTLGAAHADDFEMNVDGQPYQIRYDQVKTARLFPQFPTKGGKA